MSDPTPEEMEIAKGMHDLIAPCGCPGGDCDDCKVIGRAIHRHAEEAVKAATEEMQERLNGLSASYDSMCEEARTADAALHDERQAREKAERRRARYRALAQRLRVNRDFWWKKAGLYAGWVCDRNDEKAVLRKRVEDLEQERDEVAAGVRTGAVDVAALCEQARQEGRDESAARIKELEAEFVDCICPGCLRRVPRAWEAWTCQPCAAEDCDHPQGGKDAIEQARREGAEEMRERAANVAHWEYYGNDAGDKIRALPIDQPKAHELPLGHTFVPCAKPCHGSRPDIWPEKQYRHLWCHAQDSSRRGYICGLQEYDHL
jgi:hypothetical protein